MGGWVADRRGTLALNTATVVALLSGAAGGGLLGWWLRAPRDGFTPATDERLTNVSEGTATNAIRAETPCVEADTFASLARARDAGVASPARPTTVADLEPDIGSVLAPILARVASEVARPGLEPEEGANLVDQFVEGWIQGVLVAAPEDADRIGRGLAAGLCDESRSDVERLVLVRLASRVSDRTEEAEAGIECVLLGRDGEDIVLWEALDAATASRMTTSAGWRRWREFARDERTRMRFAPRGGRPPRDDLEVAGP